MKTWFLIDVVTTFPWGLIGYGNYSHENENIAYNTKLMRILRLNRLYRITRMLKLVQVINLEKLVKYLFNDGSSVKVFNLSYSMRHSLGIFLMYIVLTHWVACLWYLQARYRHFNENTWIGANDLQYEKKDILFIQSYYWALQTVTSVGYGDFNGLAHIFEQHIAILWCLTGFFLQSFLIGHFIQCVKVYNEDHEYIHSRISQIKAHRTKY